MDLETSQSATCASTCGPLVPNGCDCFGCCEVVAGSGNYAWLGSLDGTVRDCTSATASDPNKCRPCTPVAACLNDCATCEVCIGRGADLLPPACGGVQTCDGGHAPCGNGVTCDAGEYCVTGCCQPTP